MMMKLPISILLFLFLFALQSDAQIGRGKITAAEYFFDTDPGIGLATSLTLQGNINDAMRNAVQTSAQSLAAGKHTFNVRMKDSVGNWSPIFKTVLSVENLLSARNITMAIARIYWDVNSAGAANLLILNGNITDAINTFITATPFSSFASAGSHILNVQVMGADGNYSVPFKSSINVENATTLTRIISAALGRAYWDNNLGSQQGLIILNGNAGNAINEFITTNPLSGFASDSKHTLHVQLLDPNGSGNYSPAFTTVVKIEDEIDTVRALRVDAGRVWFDNNLPGSPNMIAFDGNFNSAIETAMQTLNTPSLGLHTLNVQLRDSTPSQWGPIFKTTLIVETPLSYRNINVASGQLYWDNDTNNMPQTLIAFDGAFDNSIEDAFRNNNATPGLGLHTLCVRFKDVANNWSNPFKIILNVEDSLFARNIKITQGEVRVDNTPPITIVALNGNFTNAVEEAQTTILTAGLPLGLHRLLTRIKGNEGNWGPYFITSVLISPCATQPMPTVTHNRPLSFCGGDSTILSANAGYTSYQWIRDNVVVGTGQSYVAKDSGAYTVIVTDGTNCPGASVPILVNAHNRLLTITGSNLYCPGSLDTLVASIGFTSYAWSAGSTTNKQAVTAGGIYSVTATDNFGCSSTANIQITQLVSPPIPTISASGPLTFCAGSNVTLTSSAATNIVWNTGSTDPSITVDTSGFFKVTVTGANGCTSTSTIVQTHRSTPTNASITSNGSSILCTGQSVTLSSYPGLAYSWSNGATSSSITVSTAGSYSVQLTDSNGCATPLGPINIIVHPVPPIPSISASGPLSFCNGLSVTLTSSAASNNTWNNGVQTQAQTIYMSGTFVDTVTNSFGCKSWSTPTVVDVHPVASISANGPTTFCFGNNVTLTASPANGVTYQWSNGATTPSVTITNTQNLSVIVTENGLGCKDTAYQNVLVNPLPTGSIIAQGATTVCNGTTITFNATGSANTKFRWFLNGSPIINYSYNIYCNCYVPYFIYGSSFTTGSGGNYSAEIIDTLTGCVQQSNTIHTIVNVPQTPVITANGGTTICIGANTILSASAAVSYLWSTGATTQTITATSQGTYTVSTIDINGCVSTSAQTPVSFYTSASITASGPTTFCAGENVSLTAHPIGTYLWTNGSTNASISNITSNGSFGVTVTDANGCITTAAPVQITVNPLPIGSVNVTGPTTVCLGNSVNYSTTPYPNTIYKWFKNGIAIFYLSYNIYCNCYVPIYTYGYTFSAFSSGNYSAQAIDTLTGCTSMTNSILTTILPLPTPTITQTAFNVCNGGSSGSLLGNASGTVSPYTYLWNTGSTSTFLNNLISATYTLQVTDANNCSAATQFTVGQPAPIAASAVSPTNTRGYNVTCYGASDGSATVNPNGGTAPYTYVWSTGATTQTIQNIGAGTYTVTVMDANNCTPATATVTLAQPNAVGLTLSPSVFYGGKNISCFGGSNGSITAITSGGTANFTYQWSNGQIASQASGLIANTYSVIVTDSVGCSATDSILLTQPDALQSTLTSSQFSGYNISCFGFADGSITTQTSGGTAPYQYAWLDGNNNKNRTNLVADTFYVTTIDTLGCIRNDSILLTQPTEILSSLTGSLLNCYGDSNGVASAIISGGNAPYTYLWDNGILTSSMQNLKANIYVLTVTDSRGCSKVDQAEVTQPPAVNAYAFGTYIGCGSQIGLLSVSANGGNAPYTYLWNNGSTTTFQINQPLGTYSVMVTDSHGCWDSATAIILSPPALTASMSNDFHASCDSITTVPAGTLTVTPNGGVAPYLYLWSNGATTPSIQQLSTGNYSVIVTDANGCTATPSGNVFNNDPAIILGDSIICSGAQAQLSTIPSLVYTWSNVGGIVSTNQQVNLSAGAYTLTATNLNGCINSATVNVIELPICNTVLNVKVFLQGYYSGSQQMVPTLANQGIGFSNTITDTVVAELRSTVYPYPPVASSKSILHTDGTATFNFSALSQSYYIYFKHRNTLQTWSSDSVLMGSIPAFYDFTTSASKAYGDNMVEVDPGVWAIYSGDLNSDDNVDLADYGLMEIDINNFESGYKTTDINGDGNVDLSDVPAVEYNITNFIFAEHP